MSLVPFAASAVLLAATPEATTGAASGLPGAEGAALEASGDPSEVARSCSLYRADAVAHPQRAGAAWLRASRCLARRATQGEASAEERAALAGALEQLLADGTVGRDLLVAEEAADGLVKTEADSARGETAAAKSLAWIVDEDPPRSGAERRGAYARLVLRVFREASAGRVGDAALARRALERLYVDVAETAAAEEALRLPAARALSGHGDAKLALARANVLEAQHANQALLGTLRRHRPKASDVSEQACEVRTLLGKTQRKLRRYKAARQELDLVAEQCAEPWRKKARYLAARVSTFQSDAGTEAILDRFLASYPDDTLTDDVLVWKAELLIQGRRFEEADQVYARIADEHPTGDMLWTSRFDRAFLRAERKDPDGAISLLDEIARTSLKAPPIISDQALYWRGRLKAFPDTASWEPTADTARAQEGLRELVALAVARPASFYGHLAGQVALEHAARLGATAQQVTAAFEEARLPGRNGPGRHAAAGSRVASGEGLTLPAQLSDARLQAARAMIEGGYLEEAGLVLDQVLDRSVDQKLSEGDRAAVPVLYGMASRLDRTHQVMRNRGLALPPGRPEGEALALWSLTFPRAHEGHLAAAAEKGGVPTAVLLGLAREESAFEASVVSWAGAIGLCQLMPTTAAEEAQRMKYAGPVGLEALREPSLNARLGAEHLGRRWRELKHPLLAIAAYNAGPGNVRRWQKRLPKPIDAFVEGIPVEQTRNYVRKVTGSWVTYSVLDPQDFGEVRYPLLVP